MNYTKYISMIGIRVLIFLLAASLILYLCAFIYLCLNQRTLVFPGTLDRGAGITPLPGCRVITLLTPRLHLTVHALYAPALSVGGTTETQITPSPTILFFTGNGGDINGLGAVVSHLRELGANVLVPEYPGYGQSTGQASDIACYDTAEAAYDFAASIDDKSKIVAAGWSLGSGVAIHLASTRRVAGLATFSAYTSMANMASHTYPIFPAMLLNAALRYKFPSLKMIRNVHCPIFLAHGTADNVIPFSMLKQMQTAAAGPVTVCTVIGGDHGMLFDGSGDSIYPDLAKWIEKITAKSNI